MASLTFYNLPQEKKNRIVKAAVKEFSRVPLEKALISNIIKDADIPRGSFYQYFENIDDFIGFGSHHILDNNQVRFLSGHLLQGFEGLEDYGSACVGIVNHGVQPQAVIVV